MGAGGWRDGVQKASLSALHLSGMDVLLARLMGGIGAILVLHHVRPATPMAFAPNAHLEVTPEFLDRAIRFIRERGYDVISLDEASIRLAGGDLDRPFVCFAFDDAYRDVVRHAAPVFEQRDAPYAVFVASDFADGCGDLWWRALEQTIRQVDSLEIKIAGQEIRFDCARPDEKMRAYERLRHALRPLPELDIRALVDELCRRYGVKVDHQGAAAAMSWDELRTLATDSRVTIGAHTRRHLPLDELSYAEARAEIEASGLRIERELARPCRHFSFPEGGRGGAGPREFRLATEAGLATAISPRPGVLKAHHARALTALPRVPLCGDLQKPHYLKVLLSGVPFVLHDLRARSGFGLTGTH